MFGSFLRNVKENNKQQQTYSIHANQKQKLNKEQQKQEGISEH